MGRLQRFRNAIIYLVILVAIAVVFFGVFRQPSAPKPFRSISQVVADAQNGLIRRIDVEGSNGDLLVIYRDAPEMQYASRMERGESITRLLLDAGVDLNSIRIVVNQSYSTSEWTSLLLGFMPVVIVVAVLYFMMRQARSGNQVAKNLVKHTWKVDHKPTVTFADIGGLREAKEAVGDIIAYLKDPGRFGGLGARMPRAVLVQGPPGVGKGLFVQAVAGEAGVKLISCISSEFMEIFVGVGPARLRDLFLEAQKLAPVVVFLDELDAIGRLRVETDKQSNASEQQLLLSQLFVELDELHAKPGVVLFAATNRPDLVDPALLRAGRLGREISIGLPTEDERLEILRILVRGRSLAQDVKLEEIARQTPGRTGADLASIVNQAAILALKGGPATSGGAITHDDLSAGCAQGHRVNNGSTADLTG